MIHQPLRRAGGALVVAAAAVSLAACAGLPAARAPAASAKGGGGGAVAAAPDSLAIPAQALESYLRRARGIDGKIAGPAAVNAGLNLGAAHDPKQLETGIVALAAVAALQEPSFVAGVKAASRKPADRKALVARLGRDPAAVLALGGAKKAAGRAGGALRDASSPLVASGRDVKKASYSVQLQKWSQATVADPKGRLARVKQISAAGYSRRPDDGRLLGLAVASDRQGPAASAAVTRGVAAAAFVVMGEAVQAKAMLKEPNAGLCLRIAKLNFFQCLASAGPYYEDIYCLGEHAMIEPAQCVAGATKARPVRTAARADRAG